MIIMHKKQQDSLISKTLKKTNDTVLKDLTVDSEWKDVNEHIKNY